MRGEDEAGVAIDVRHPLAGLLREKATEGGSDPKPVLRIAALFGDLADDPIFVATVGKQLKAIYGLGMKRALASAAAELGF